MASDKYIKFEFPVEKRAITEKEETLKVLETLIFYHNVQYSVRYVDYEPNVFTVPTTLTKDRLQKLNDSSIAEIRFSFKPDFLN